MPNNCLKLYSENDFMKSKSLLRMYKKLSIEKRNMELKRDFNILC